jgi:hypothetical protein
MPTTRRSSRLKGDAPRVEPITRRARRPNKNTFTKFAKTQLPVTAKGSGIRKKFKTLKQIRALIKLIKALTNILATPLPFKSTNPPIKVTLLLIRGILSQARKKLNIILFTTLFNLTIEGESAHYVTLIITLVIDSSRKINTIIY